MSLRPAPLLQSERSFSVSSDNGTTTPLPVPYNDFWDINTVPNAGLTQVYQITNISEYQGRVIYVNKTQNTAGGTVRISLPGGYTFSSTGTQNYDFPDAPTQLIISISTSSVVAIQTGGSGVGPNSTLINYQVPDLNLGTGNVISSIQDSPGNNYIDLVTGGKTTITSAGKIELSTNDVFAMQASQGYTVSIPPTKVFAISGTGTYTNSSNTTHSGNFTASNAIVNLTALANVSTTNVVNYNTANGRLTYAPKANGTTINYQVADLDLGSGNIITTIGDTSLITSVECNGTNVVLSAAGGNVQTGGLVTEIQSLNGMSITNLPSSKKPSIVFYDTTTKNLSYGTSPLFRTATLLNTTLANGSASGTVYGTLTTAASTFLAAGNELTVEYVLSGYAAANNQSQINFTGGASVALPALATGKIRARFMWQSGLVGAATVYYIIEFDQDTGAGNISKIVTQGSYGAVNFGAAFVVSLNSTMITTALLTVNYAVANLNRN